MEYIASNISVSLDAMLPRRRKLLRREVARAIGVDAAIVHDLRVVRKSVDARKKNNVHYVVSCTFKLMQGAESADAESSSAESQGAGCQSVECQSIESQRTELQNIKSQGTKNQPETKTADEAVKHKAAKGASTKHSTQQKFTRNTEAENLPAKTSAQTNGENAFEWPYKVARGVAVRRYEPFCMPAIPDLSSAFEKSEIARPLVVGAGPAGLFCALWLARAGMRPLVVERGQAVEQREKAVREFASGGALNPNSNIQFGEGGAGTFSDGKLTCGKNDPYIRAVLHDFVSAGAPEDILVDAKPHIGTDYLPKTVQGLRHAIEDNGGEFMFCTQLVGLHPTASEDSLFPAREHTCWTAELLNLESGESVEFHTSSIVLAIGHSARDTVQMLLDSGAAMQRKPFAVGVRIEHPQQLINKAQYGKAAGHATLPPADYKLAVRTKSDRGVYTFCMCPGGEVVAAASESGGVCVNGMSEHARAGSNANSALLVEVHPDDFPGEDVMEGVRFQRNLERAAYDLAQKHAHLNAAQTLTHSDAAQTLVHSNLASAENALNGGAIPYAAPAQTVGSFLSESKVKNVSRETFVSYSTKYNPEQAFSAEPTDANELSCDKYNSEQATPLNENVSRETFVRPSYPRGVVWANLHECLPSFVADSIAEALPKMDKKLHGFADPHAVMTAVEARSSSPVRIVRDKVTLQSTSLEGLFPAGEGAGYAGGITSAATDGIRVALAVMRRFVLQAMGANLSQSIEHLNTGGALVFDTDTVAGLGVAVRAAKSPQVLYELKGRSYNKPVSWLVGSADALCEYGECVPEYAQVLAEHFWPGPLTLVVRANANVPAAFASKANTLGLRMPNSAQTLSLIESCGPLATTSANMSGQPAPTSIYQADSQLMVRAGCVFVPAIEDENVASFAAETKEEPSPHTFSSVSSCVLSSTSSRALFESSSNTLLDTSPHALSGVSSCALSGASSRTLFESSPNTPPDTSPHAPSGISSHTSPDTSSRTLSDTSPAPHMRANTASSQRTLSGTSPLRHAPCSASSSSQFGGVASTVVDCTGSTPKIIREGFITSADIDAALLYSSHATKKSTD